MGIYIGHTADQRGSLRHSQRRKEVIKPLIGRESRDHGVENRGEHMMCHDAFTLPPIC